MNSQNFKKIFDEYEQHRKNKTKFEYPKIVTTVRNSALNELLDKDEELEPAKLNNIFVAMKMVDAEVNKIETKTLDTVYEEANRIYKALISKYSEQIGEKYRELFKSMLIDEINEFLVAYC